MNNIIVLPTKEENRVDAALMRVRHERQKLSLSGHSPEELLYQLGCFFMFLSMECRKNGGAQS